MRKIQPLIDYFMCTKTVFVHRNALWVGLWVGGLGPFMGCAEVSPEVEVKVVPSAPVL